MLQNLIKIFQHGFFKGFKSMFAHYPNSPAKLETKGIADALESDWKNLGLDIQNVLNRLGNERQ